MNCNASVEGVVQKPHTKTDHLDAPFRTFSEIIDVTRLTGTHLDFENLAPTGSPITLSKYRRWPASASQKTSPGGVRVVDDRILPVFHYFSRYTPVN